MRSHFLEGLHVEMLENTDHYSPRARGQDTGYAAANRGEAGTFSVVFRAKLLSIKRET